MFCIIQCSYLLIHFSPPPQLISRLGKQPEFSSHNDRMLAIHKQSKACMPNHIKASLHAVRPIACESTSYKPGDKVFVETHLHCKICHLDRHRFFHLELAGTCTSNHHYSGSKHYLLFMKEAQSLSTL